MRKLKYKLVKLSKVDVNYDSGNVGTDSMTSDTTIGYF